MFSPFPIQGAGRVHSGAIKKDRMVKENYPNVLIISSRRDMLVFEISDHRAFKILITNKDASKSLTDIGKHLGVKTAVLGPGLKLRIIQDRRWTWKQAWYVLSGERRADRLIKKALEEYEEGKR